MRFPQNCRAGRPRPFAVSVDTLTDTSTRSITHGVANRRCRCRSIGRAERLLSLLKAKAPSSRLSELINTGSGRRADFAAARSQLYQVRRPLPWVFRWRLLPICVPSKTQLPWANVRLGSLWPDSRRSASSDHRRADRVSAAVLCVTRLAKSAIPVGVRAGRLSRPPLPMRT